MFPLCAGGEREWRMANSKEEAVSIRHSPFASSIRHSLFAIRYSLFALSPLADAEYEQARLLRVGFQHIAGLAQQVGDVDRGERIGAFDHEPVADREPLERLAGFQRRQRALQPAQIEDGLGHWGA